MKPRTKRILLILGGVLLLATGALAGLGYYIFSENSPRNRASAVAATLDWGRLASFPVSKKDLTITTTGSMFTRSFRVSFVAPAAEIERWLQQSPGTNETIPSTPSPGVRHYEIKPGGGAQSAEVEVDDTQHRVVIYVSWS